MKLPNQRKHFVRGKPRTKVAYSASPANRAQFCGSNKLAWEKKKQAIHRAANLAAAEGYPMFVYKCKSCRMWHMTRHAEFGGEPSVRAG